jgi:hypothetical protein
MAFIGRLLERGNDSRLLIFTSLLSVRRATGKWIPYLLYIRGLNISTPRLRPRIPAKCTKSAHAVMQRAA